MSTLPCALKMHAPDGALAAAMRVIQADGHQPTPALVAVVAARLLRAQGIQGSDGGTSFDAPASSQRQSSPASSSSTGCGSAAAAHHHHHPRPMVFRANQQRQSAAESRPSKSQSPAPGSSSGTRGGKGRVTCQVAGCPQDLAAGRETYTGRYRVCARHIVEPAVVLYADQPRELYRFCNQCFKFEKLAAFDGAKRGCRASLAKRRERSRNKKMQQAAAAAAAAAGLPAPWQPQPQGRRGAGAGQPASPGFISQAQQDGGGFAPAAAFASGLRPQGAHQQGVPGAAVATGGLMAELLSALSPEPGNSTPAVSSGNSPACPDQGTTSPQLLLLQQQLSNQGAAGAAALAGAPSALQAPALPAARSPPPGGTVLGSRDMPQLLLQRQQQQQGQGAQSSNAELGWCMSAPLGLLLDPSMQRCTSAPNLAGIAGQSPQAGSNPALQQLLASAAFGGGDLPGSQVLQLQDMDSPRAGQRTQQQPAAAAAAAAATAAAAVGKPPPGQHAARHNSDDSGGCVVDEDDDAAWMDVRELSFTLSERCSLQDQGGQQQQQLPQAAAAAAQGAGSRDGAPPPFTQLPGAAAGEAMDCMPCNRTPSCSHSSSNPSAAPGVVTAAPATAAKGAAASLAAAQQHPAARGAGGNPSSNPCPGSLVYDAMLDELTAWFLNPGGADGAPAGSAPEAEQQVQNEAARGWSPHQLPSQEQPAWRAWQQKQQQQLNPAPSAPAALGSNSAGSGLQAAPAAGRADALAVALPAASSVPLAADAGASAAVAVVQLEQVFDQAASALVSNMELAVAQAAAAAATLPSASGSLGDAPSSQQQQQQELQLRASSADMVDSWNAAFAAAGQQRTPPLPQRSSLEQQQAGHSLAGGKPGEALTYRLERQLSAAQKVMLDMERKLAALKTQQQGKP